LFNSKGVDTSADEGAPDDDFVFCPPTPAVVVVVVVAVRPESFRRAAKMTLIIFEASVLKSFRIFPMTSFLSFCGKTACAGKREFQVLYSTFYIHYIRDDDERQ